MIKMRPGYLQADKAERAKAAGAAVAINLLLGTALLTGLALHVESRRDTSLATFDVETPIPPALEVRQAKPAKSMPAPAGKKASPSPIVAPPAKIPDEASIRAARVAGQVAASSAGAAVSGTGTGAGGSGNGLGAGGNGGGRTGAILVSGRLTNRDYRALAGPDLPSGSAMYVLLVNPAGRVERCRVAAAAAQRGSINGYVPC